MNTSDSSIRKDSGDEWLVMYRPHGGPVFYAPGKGFRVEVDASLMMWRDATEEEAAEAIACYNALDSTGELDV